MMIKNIAIQASRPAVRAFMRYCPFQPLRRLTWYKCTNPLYAWRPYPFVAKTYFGAEIQGNTHDLIQSHIYFLGMWEPRISRWVASRLNPGDTFIDVGANIGYFSLLAATRVGSDGMVLSVEACPEIYRHLAANLRRNRVKSVSAINVAASSARGRLKLYRGIESNGGSTTTISDGSGDCPYEEVDALPLHEIVTDAQVQRLKLIKIDVEGAEYDVLQGAAKILERAPVGLEILVELHPSLLEKQNKSAGDVIALMQAHGFNAYFFPGDSSTDIYFAPQRTQALERLNGQTGRIETVVFSREDAGFI